MKSLIETTRFPTFDINNASIIEKQGGGRPDHWEMIFWWTRKPLASARAIIAGALLPENFEVRTFKKILRLNLKVSHKYNPETHITTYSKFFAGKSLLDPFAGFGSIPLEALRLGLGEVCAVELLPTCYVFLKAVLDFPLKWGKQLIDDVKKWADWITKQLESDRLVKQLYDSDVAAYIGSWSIKCPICNKWTILVANWWLARTFKKKNGKKVYNKLVWMRPTVKDEEILVEVEDLSNFLGKTQLEEINIDAKKGIVNLLNLNRQFNLPKPSIDARKESMVCLHCNSTIRYINPNSGKLYTNPSKLPKRLKNELVGYVKFALKKYVKGDPSLARPILLIKVNKKNGKLHFEPCSSKDQKRMEIARKEIMRLLEEQDPDIPLEPLAPYGTQAIGGYLQPINYDITQWYKMFNPRQLLILIKLTKMIRKAAQYVQNEKIRKGFDEESASEYAKAVATYLSIALCKFADFNSLMNRWNPGWLKFEETLSVRGIAMMWNWVDVNPFAPFTGSWLRSVKNVINALEYLVNALDSEANNLLVEFSSKHHRKQQDRKIQVLIDDATILHKIDPAKKFDLIVTDPPYYADVPYAELSDFYYVWLKRALSEVNGTKLIPRFFQEAFFKRIGAKWVEIKTQWEEFARREVSLNPPRLGPKANMIEGKQHFLNLLKQSFKSMRGHLKDDGLLITYYAHTSPDAWIALLEAGWNGGKLYVVNAFPLATESLQRVTARGKYALDTSIVVVWRKGCSGSIGVDDLYEKAVKGATSAAVDLIKLGRTGSDLFVGTMASILSIFTRYERLYGPTGPLDVKSLVTDYVYPATAKALAMALGKFAGSPGEVKRPESLFYLITKALFPKMGKAKRKLDRTNVALISIGTKADINGLQKFRILYREKENFYLEEPATGDRKSFEEILRRKGINPTKPVIESTINALHLLEYYSVTLPLNSFLTKFSQLKEEYSSEVEEAINIAAILAKVLPSTDPEKKACEEIIARIKGEKLA